MLRVYYHAADEGGGKKGARTMMTMTMKEGA